MTRLDLHEALDELAKLNGLSSSDVARLAIEQVLESHAITLKSTEPVR